MNRTGLQLTLAFSLLSTVAMAGVQHRIYDLTDAAYRANGLDPVKLVGRVQPPTGAVFDNPIFSYQRNVRLTATNSAYGASGNMQFFSILAVFGPNAFTADAAGRHASDIANRYTVFTFPSRGTDPLGLGNPRQSVIQDTRNGYFSNDPFGLWRLVWISYTDKAFKTSDGQKALNDLAKKNGMGLDGTPIIRSTSDIDNLYSKGYVTKMTRNDSLRYIVCPVILDPKDGGIAPDDVYHPLRRSDGTLVESWFDTAFNNLQKFGDWDNRP